MHTWSRASMGQDRLSALAMLHVQYMHKIEILEVVDKFSKIHPRRMQLDSGCSTNFDILGLSKY